MVYIATMMAVLKGFGGIDGEMGSQWMVAGGDGCCRWSSRERMADPLMSANRTRVLSMA